MTENGQGRWNEQNMHGNKRYNVFFETDIKTSWQ